MTGRPAAGTVLLRAPGPYEFSRATWEINLGCDFDCEHCYLGKKRFEGLDWAGKSRLLHVMRDAGVLWLQITGGEPLIDPDFPDAYRLANELGMQVEILSNGSRLKNDKILSLLIENPPSKMSLSVYGATADTYDGLTRRRGAFDRFTEGLGKATTSQSPEHLTQRAPYNGCPAGHTFFHADPHGRASICEVGRDPHIDLIAEGVEGLARLGGIADGLMLRTGGCSGCQISGTCRVCRPMAKVFQEAKAPLRNYCQHGDQEVAQ
ncbi:radical SAM protein [Streptomyces sp. NPDC053427]|uniref:radical SAM protein n=1 Tax=Streptomyces sp. NPDC053427 TaxID=3365701 RepID=UPI0037D087B1